MMRTDLVKVVLYAYPQLTALAEASEVAARNRALLSYRDPRPCDEVAARVAEEAEFACALRALAADAAAVFGELSELERALIAHKYFKHGDVPADSRSYYRRQLALIARITRKFTRLGWTDERFFGLFGRYAPFMNLLRRIGEKGDRGLFRNLRRPACARGPQAPQ